MKSLDFMKMIFQIMGKRSSHNIKNKLIEYGKSLIQMQNFGENNFTENFADKSFGKFINTGDEILITELEHHSNYVP